MSLRGRISVMVLALAALSSDGIASSPEIGKPAPAFTALDVQGKSHSVADFKGKVVVLEWSNPGCPFVQRVYRENIITALQQEYTKKGVIWLVVNSTNKDHGDYQEPADLGETYKDWKASPTGVLMDPDGKVGKAYGARTTPHMFIINKDGNLVYNGALDSNPRGGSDERIQYVRAALDEVLAGKPVTTSTTTPYGCSVKY
jgi:peroxiredoxin